VVDGVLAVPTGIGCGVEPVAQAEKQAGAA
jgi:hypothetical protein